ncbi:MAG: PKD domain-containing protein, partial [Candidatus Binatia bacterium]
PPLASGTVTGSSLSRTVPGMGTWTWSAVGSYTWRWKEFLSLAIRWEGRSAINQVQGQFTTFWDYTPPGDAFSDSQVTGGTWWLASMQNGTGQPVASLELTLDSALALDAAWPGPDPILMGPPTYQWSFGDLPPGSEAAAAVQPTSPDAALVTFAPGFDVSRSADKTVFTALDTQTLTITVTPRQAMEGFFTIVFAEENDLVNPIITSFTGGEGGEISPDGRQLFMGAAGGIGTPVTFTVTIQVTPKVPTVEFMPAVWVITPGEFLGKGTASGSSVSSTVNTLGTWTWSAVGNYSWGWQAFVLRAVTFPAYSHNTPTGTNVEVAVDGNTVTFGQVTTSGNTKVTTTSTGPAIPSLFKLGTPPTYFDFTTTAVYSPPVTLCMDYSAIRFGNEGQLKLWQWSGTGWLDITISLDTQNDIICGQGSTLSIFAIVEPNLPPVAQASVDVYLAPVGSVFAFDGSASYDPDGTIVSYDWSFDDSSSGSGVSVTHSYAAAGLYDVVLTVTDDLGAQGSDTVLVVVYDPAAGFATGGGWFVPGGPTSDLGDRLPGLDNTSPANFGFVVKYKPGATTPDGQLEFQYRQGDFNLHSSGMDWLVIVNNNWAKFHGSATIKGLEGLFPFRVDARDGDFSGGNQPDRFIIKVWAPGADPDTDDPIYKASGDLQGGNIIIHTK